MPYSKKLWLSAGAVVLAVIIVVAFISLRSEEVQRAALFSKPEEVVEATGEFELAELPPLDVMIEREGPEQVGTPMVVAELEQSEQLEQPDEESLEKKRELLRVARGQLIRTVISQRAEVEEMFREWLEKANSEEAEAQMNDPEYIQQEREELVSRLKAFEEEREEYQSLLENEVQDFNRAFEMVYAFRDLYGDKDMLEKTQKRDGFARLFEEIDQRIVAYREKIEDAT